MLGTEEIDPLIIIELVLLFRPRTMTTGAPPYEEGAIPIIDFSPWVTDNASEEDKSRVSQEIFSAFSTIGFVVIVNHGIQDDVTKRGFASSRAFFELDKETKMLYKYLSAESNRGYIAMGQEKLDGDLPDIKETFDIGFEGEKDFPNRWPVGTDIADEFKITMLEYFNEYDKLHLNILRALSRGMGFDSDEYFTPLCNGESVGIGLATGYQETSRRSFYFSLPVDFRKPSKLAFAALP